MLARAISCWLPASPARAATPGGKHPPYLSGRPAQGRKLHGPLCRFEPARECGDDRAIDPEACPLPRRDANLADGASLYHNDFDRLQSIAVNLLDEFDWQCFKVGRRCLFHHQVLHMNADQAKYGCGIMSTGIRVRAKCSIIAAKVDFPAV